MLARDADCARETTAGAKRLNISKLLYVQQEGGTAASWWQNNIHSRQDASRPERAHNRKGTQQRQDDIEVVAYANNVYTIYAHLAKGKWPAMGGRSMKYCSNMVLLQPAVHRAFAGVAAHREPFCKTSSSRDASAWQFNRPARMAMQQA